MNQRIATVHALRGLAALAVVLYHIALSNIPLLEDAGIRHILIRGYLGVDVFFVISGFVIPLSMMKYGYRLGDAGVFMVKRLIRLEPPYIASLILCIMLAFIAPYFGGSVAADFSAEEVLLHVGYLIPFTDHSWMNVAYWTLAIEFQFYLLMCLFFPLLSRYSVWVLLVLSHVFYNTAFLPCWLGLFALGMMTYLYYTKQITTKAFLPMILIATLSNFAVHGVEIAGAGLATSLVIAYIRVPSITLLAFLGAISYSLYLTHIYVIRRLSRVMLEIESSVYRDITVIIAMLVLSILAAYLLYRLVEKPSQTAASNYRYRLRALSPSTRLTSSSCSHV